MRRFCHRHYAVLWIELLLISAVSGAYVMANRAADEPYRAVMAYSGSGWELAGRWAEAVKNRDGKAQYALMTKDLQESVYDEFSGLNWVTGTSSPWVESYTIQATDSGAKVSFRLATSTGSAGSCSRNLSFSKEAGILKISHISAPIQDDVNAWAPGPLSFKDLAALLGMTRAELLSAVGEPPVAVDEGGLGFVKAGIRVWFDSETHTRAAQVLIMTSAIDLNGVRLGESINGFKKVFGEPLSDRDGDARFSYDNIVLSVNYDTSTGKTAAVYLLSKNV